MTKHPALHMSKVRQQVWLKEASDEDFFDMVTLLARLYAKRKYSAKVGYKAASLLADYPEHVKKTALEKTYKNNVPFKSSSDAPGSVVIEEVPEQKSTLEELMDLI